MSRTSQHCRPSENIHRSQKSKIFYGSKATELLIGMLNKVLSEFNFKIIYKLSKQREKPDMLTQRSQNILKRMKNLRQRYQFQTLL